ncbi:MAG: hypothetical protein Q4E91_01670 [Lachnospiraceae bacterium]|nr:hypothetical protein [Lachnospiraceae bacterium]
MFNLMKYEFRKNRNILLVMGGGLLLLQLFYLYSIIIKNDEKAAVGMVLLTIFAWVCFFSVFILAVINYSRELNSKSSYLIFMTPNSSYTIIFSKMLSILIIGSAMAVIFGLLGFLDLQLLSATFPEVGTLSSLLNEMLDALGIPLNTLLPSALSALITFIIYFFASVAIVYLSVTLSATFLQNSKLKSYLSVGLFFLISFLQGKIIDLLPVLYDPPHNILESILGILPGTLFSLALLIVCIYSCGKLLEKRVSL